MKDPLFNRFHKLDKKQILSMRLDKPPCKEELVLNLLVMLYLKHFVYEDMKAVEELLFKVLVNKNPHLKDWLDKESDHFFEVMKVIRY